LEIHFFLLEKFLELGKSFKIGIIGSILLEDPKDRYNL
jgi:hypothetical protein